jgi:TRAP-type transport system periplasmic protein
MKRREVMAGAAAFAAAAGATGSARAQAVRFRLAHFSPTSDPNHVTALAFAEALKRETNGEYDVTILPAAQLGGEVAVTESLLLGAVDMAPPSAAVLANWMPEMNVLNMPFAFRDWDALHARGARAAATTGSSRPRQRRTSVSSAC